MPVNMVPSETILLKQASAFKIYPLVPLVGLARSLDGSRECLAVVVDNSLSGQRVGRELDAIAEYPGYGLDWAAEFEAREV